MTNVLMNDECTWVYQRRFSTIYATKFWHPLAESHSGPGSGSDEVTAGTRKVRLCNPQAFTQPDATGS